MCIMYHCAVREVTLDHSTAFLGSISEHCFCPLIASIMCWSPQDRACTHMQYTFSGTQPQHVTVVRAQRDATIEDLQSRYNILLEKARMPAPPAGDKGASQDHSDDDGDDGDDNELSSDTDLSIEDDNLASPPASRHSSQVALRDVGDRRVWVMRHGHRQDEADPTWTVSSERPYDPPLSEEGRLQAFETGKVLAERAHFCAIVCSPFLRCLQVRSVYVFFCV
jgi:hypothetical protein